MNAYTIEELKELKRLHEKLIADLLVVRDKHVLFCSRITRLIARLSQEAADAEIRQLHAPLTDLTACTVKGSNLSR